MSIKKIGFFNALVELSKTEISSIHDFILESTIKIVEQKDCDKSEVLICLPNYLSDFFKNEYLNHIDWDPTSTDVIYFYGFRVQFSYDNSITVFYNAYLPNEIIKYTKTL